MVYKLDIEYKAEKEKIFNKLHINENTEAYKYANDVFLELHNIIKESMKLTVLYSIVDSFNLGYKELEGFEKYIFCFVSANNDLNTISNDMMSSGEYLKGYLLNEMATDYIFSASNELNNIIREQANNLGYKTSRRYAPGDDGFELKNQKNILDLLKNEVDIDAYVTENHMIVPEKSLLYLYGLEQNALDKCDLLPEHGCTTCSNINCEYREVNNEKS